MTESDQHILLAKWLDGTLTDEEAKALQGIKNINGLKTALNRLDEYDFPPMDEAAIFEKITQKRRPRQAKTRHLIPRWVQMTAAAIFILLAGASIWLWTEQGTTVFASLGEHKKLTLPAHSEVVLNAGSKLRYFEKNWQTERRMKLEGEAFFKVTKGVPFQVESDNGLVEVLGTQFNVFDRDGIFKVVCFEGKVQVVSEKANLEKILEKGEGVRIKGNNFVTYTIKDTIPDWERGVSVFSKTPLSQVFDEIGRQYDINFIFLNVNLQHRYSGEFPHDNLEGALELVCGAMSLNYKINAKGKEVRIRPAD